MSETSRGPREMKTFLVELDDQTRLLITADTYFESTIGDTSEYVFVLRAPDGTNTLRTFKAAQVTRIEPAAPRGGLRTSWAA